MQIQALHTVHKSGWTPAYDWWADHQIDHASEFTACARWIEFAPVLPATVLGLELLLQDRSLHLQMAADLILKDLGATLHIMRLVAREFPIPTDRPTRLVDCLAALDTAAWFAELSSKAISSSKLPADVASAWKHCRCVATFAKLIAESLGEVCVEEAYIAGLMHEVGNLGSLFKEEGEPATGKGQKLAEVLSPTLMSNLHAAKQRGSTSVWRYVLASAHALATATPSASLAASQLRPAKPFMV